MDVYYNDRYAASDFAFDTTRKASAIAKSLADAPIPDVHLVDPYDKVNAADIEQIVGTMHANSYVRAVLDGVNRKLAESNGFEWDEGIYPMALAHTAGMVAAARQVTAHGGFAGTLSSGLHHAKRWHGEGYCTFNGIAAAVVDTLQRNPDARIAILDVDAHCGGGTDDMVGSLEAVTHVDVFTNGFDAYPPRQGSLLLPADDRAGYRTALATGLTLIIDLHREHPFDLVIYNAGVDPIDEPFMSPEDLADRDDYVAAILCNHAVPTGFCMAGGYTGGCHGAVLTEPELVDLHTATIAAFAQYARSN